MRYRYYLSAVSIFCLLTISVASQEPCPPGLTSLANCPDVGCGNGDGKLNTLKNRTTEPPTAQARALSDIRAFGEPASWSRNQDRSSLAFRENTAVVVRGYLHDARPSGRETTNCKLGGEANNDFHLDLVSSKNAAETTAVTAEITPRLRKPGWDLDKLQSLGEARRYIRVTGWLVLDTMHIASPLQRSTNWEIHPVTKFEVCTSTRSACIAGTGWVLLEDFEVVE